MGALKKNKHKPQRQGCWNELKNGFRQIHILDNTNVYTVVIAEMVSNVFKEGMWAKAVSPYLLLLSHNNAVMVGNMITMNGVTRAVVGVLTGRMVVNNLGIESTWIITGFVGVVGILVNFACLLQGSIPAVYALSLTWATFNGLFNSSLEITWARSIVRSVRQDVNGTRQVTNKITTACGPLISAFVFIYFGNKWTVGVVETVMLLGTSFTILPVLLCFRFHSSQEVEQELTLNAIDRIVFQLPTGAKEIEVSGLKKHAFESVDDGIVKVTYPLKSGKQGKWHSRIRILTSDLRETNFVLGKQYRAAFRGVPKEQQLCWLYFEDTSILPSRVLLESVSLFLKEDLGRSVNRTLSTVRFSLAPNLTGSTHRFSMLRVVARIIGTQWGEEVAEASGMAAPLLGAADVESSVDGEKERRVSLTVPPTEEQDSDSPGRSSKRSKTLTLSNRAKSLPSTAAFVEPSLPILPSAGGAFPKVLERPKKEKETRPNILGANVIVTCDVLNAVGNGMAMKFVDLFLIVEYEVSPAGVFVVAFVQNMVTAFMTPYIKSIFVCVKDRGYRPKLVVTAVWGLSLAFLGILCAPGMPLWLVIISVVMTQSTNSCTKAFNRAQLVNYLPKEKVATYMTWDSLNKANQGGIAIFGARLIQWGGYRACFSCTFVILSFRMLLYFLFTMRKKTVRTKVARQALLEEKAITIEDLEAQEDVGFEGDVCSQLFPASKQRGRFAVAETDAEEPLGVVVADSMDFSPWLTDKGERGGGSLHPESSDCDPDSPVLRSKPRAPGK